MNEESTNIPGYPGYTIDRSGVVRLNGLIKEPRLGKDGYYVITLKNINGIGLRQHAHLAMVRQRMCFLVTIGLIPINM